jgi:hypothetical protein
MIPAEALAWFMVRAVTGRCGETLQALGSVAVVAVVGEFVATRAPSPVHFLTKSAHT